MCALHTFDNWDEKQKYYVSDNQGFYVHRISTHPVGGCWGTDFFTFWEWEFAEGKSEGDHGRFLDDWIRIFVEPWHSRQSGTCIRKARSIQFHCPTISVRVSVRSVTSCRLSLGCARERVHTRTHIAVKRIQVGVALNPGSLIWSRTLHHCGVHACFVPNQFIRSSYMHESQHAYQIINK